MDVSAKQAIDHSGGGGGSKEETSVDPNDMQAMLRVFSQWLPNHGNLHDPIRNIFTYVTGKRLEAHQPAKITDRFLVSVSRAGSGMAIGTVEIGLNTPNSSFLSTVVKKLKASENNLLPLHEFEFLPSYTILQDPKHADHQLEDFNVSEFPAGNTMDLLAIARPFSQEKIDAINRVKEDPLSISNLSHEQKSDFDIVLAAVSRGGYALTYASETLKDDGVIVLAAVSRGGNGLIYASERLQDDGDIVFAAVTKDGFELNYASKRLKDNGDIVLAAVTESGFALEYASERLKDNRNFALAAVRRSRYALGYISAELQADPEIRAAARS